MKQKILLVILCMGIIVNFGYANADGPDYWKIRGVAADDTLSVRKNHTHKSKKVAELPFNGDCLQNIGFFSKVGQSNWMHIKYNNIDGWVNGNFLRESDSDTCYTKKNQKNIAELRQGMKYSEARKIILNSGWQTINNRWQDIPKSGQVHELFYDNGWKEIVDCSGTGLAPCRFEFQDINGKILVISTVGECRYPNKKLPKQCELSLGSWSFEERNKKTKKESYTQKKYSKPKYEEFSEAISVYNKMLLSSNVTEYERENYAKKMEGKIYHFTGVISDVASRYEFTMKINYANSVNFKGDFDVDAAVRVHKTGEQISVYGRLTSVGLSIVFNHEARLINN